MLLSCCNESLASLFKCCLSMHLLISMHFYVIFAGLSLSRLRSVCEQSLDFLQLAETLRTFDTKLYASNSLHKAFYCCFSNCFIILYGMMCLAHFTTNSCSVFNPNKKNAIPAHSLCLIIETRKAVCMLNFRQCRHCLHSNTLVYTGKKLKQQQQKHLCVACRVQCSYQNWSSGDKNIPLI